MSDDRDASEESVAVAASKVDWVVTWQVCGARQRPGSPTFCHACGEPVLVWGWAP